MKMIAFLIILFISLAIHKEVLGCVTDSAVLQNYELTILHDSGNCILKYENSSNSGRLPITPKPPCYFLRRGEGEPQSFSYQNVGINKVLIIVGTLIDAEKRKRWNLSDGLVCGEEIQGVLIKGSNVMLSKTVLEGGVSCADKGTDEKNFWYFAHEDE